MGQTSLSRFDLHQIEPLILYSVNSFPPTTFRVVSHELSLVLQDDLKRKEEFNTSHNLIANQEEGENRVI